jgi:signal transduction histidine kinase/ActR/RegA family two-component response regulator
MVQAVYLAALLLFLAYAAHAALNVGGAVLDPLFAKWVNVVIPALCALVCLARARRVKAERGAWFLVALGIASWAGGNAYYSLFLIDVVPFPVPSVADGLWLAQYPFALAAVIVLMRSRLTAQGARVWLDGSIAGLSMAALSAAVVLPPVLTSAAHASLAQLMTDVAYPVGDMIVLGAVAGAIAVRSWRLDRMWGILALGFLAFTAADGIYVVEAAKGTYVVGTLLDAGWLLGALLLAAAAWQPIGRHVLERRESRRVLLLPLSFGSLALGLLIWDHYERLTAIALILSSAAIAAVVMRMTLASSENVRMLGRLREEAGVLAVKNEQLLEVDRLKDELRRSQQTEALGQLAGGVAHDFNNLLTVITGYAELLRPKLMVDPSATRQVDAIATATQRASELTRQLLTFSRRQVVETSEVDLNEVVLETREMLTAALGGLVRLETTLADDLSPISADRGQVSQVLVNLVLNARDAMPDGGTIEVTTGGCRRNSTAPENDAVLLTVSDSGEGIDEATQAKMFEPFFSTKGRDYGTGLGLSIVHGIVEDSGGSITVDSEIGAGTTFHLSFPSITSSAATPLRADTEDAHAVRSLRVLLVEDEQEVRNLVYEQLESLSHTVVAAPTPAQALELFGIGQFDVLVTDVVMPGLDGWQLARQIREQEHNLPVVLMSGYTNNAIDSIDAADVFGSTVFLSKPFTGDALAAKISAVVQKPELAYS